MPRRMHEMWPTAIDSVVAWCVSVSRSVKHLSRAKVAERIEVLFEVETLAESKARCNGWES